MTLADVVIVGGGVIGSSIAFNLRLELPSTRVLVIERDSTYAHASSNLAMGGIRQQFDALPSVLMAQYGIAFYRNFDDLLAGMNLPDRSHFHQRGYLFLADAGMAENFELRYARQRGLGVQVERLTPGQVRQVVPGIFLDDIEFGLFGPCDGYLSSRHALDGFRALATAHGAVFQDGNVTSVITHGSEVSGVEIDGKTRVQSRIVVNCAGPQAGFVASLAGVSLPVTPVRQQLFRCPLPAGYEHSLPVIVDPSGLHWRYEDPVSSHDPAHLIVGQSDWEQPPGESFTVIPDRWQQEVYPILVRRMPPYKDVAYADAWAGLYELTPDHNPILGEHPALKGFLLANGFSGHGLMLAPATGKIIASLVSRGVWQFEAQAFTYGRFERGALIPEDAIL